MSGPVIIIPARYASTRFPAKPLAMLRGKDGVSKSLVQRSWEAANDVAGIDAVYVATDDERIASHVEEFGGKALMTPESCANGTERCAAALDLIDDEPEMVVNLQGDAPLTPAWFVEELVEALRARQDVDMATPVLQCDYDQWLALVEDRRAGRVGATTAVFGRDKRALYFSKEVIPFLAPEKAAALDRVPVYHHVGVYAYRPSVLREYSKSPAGALELNEGLEQLRFMENARNVLCVVCDPRGHVFWELNNPEDVEKIETAMKIKP